LKSIVDFASSSQYANWERGKFACGEIASLPMADFARPLRAQNPRVTTVQLAFVWQPNKNFLPQSQQGV
jgi:hypothetical protein